MLFFLVDNWACPCAFLQKGSSRETVHRPCSFFVWSKETVTREWKSIPVTHLKFPGYLVFYRTSCTVLVLYKWCFARPATMEPWLWTVQKGRAPQQENRSLHVVPMDFEATAAIPHDTRKPTEKSLLEHSILFILNSNQSLLLIILNWQLDFSRHFMHLSIFFFIISTKGPFIFPCLSCVLDKVNVTQ